MSELIEVKTDEEIARQERQLEITEKWFEYSQREAKLLAASDYAPKAYKGNVANCVLAIDLARRLDMSTAILMQNTAIIHGKPAFEAKFVIALINRSQIFTRLHYVFSGTVGQDDWGCRVVTYERATGERIEGPVVTIAMAKADGWFSKDGSKWRSIPQQMLIYRAATFFGRVYCPEVTLGLHTQDEIDDMTIDVRPVGPTALMDLIQDQLGG
jgi:hypothetical protein